MTSVRWFCRTCLAQWAFAFGWKRENGCPKCGRTKIVHVRYTPAFPGGDIPLDGRKLRADAIVQTSATGFEDVQRSNAFGSGAILGQDSQVDTAAPV